MVNNDSKTSYTGLIDDNGDKCGFGTILWSDNSIYEGEWVLDRACGIGKLTHVEGDEYNGEWLNDKAHGWGV